MRLLQIDDNLTYMQDMQNELLRSGAVLCDLDSTPSLEEARQKLSDAAYDAILVDPATLDADPFEACASLHQAAPHTPIVVLTALNDDLKAAEAVASGASDYLVKEQSQPAWLMRRVRYAIERAKHAAMRHGIASPHVRSQWRETVETVLSDSVAETGKRPVARRRTGASPATTIDPNEWQPISDHRAFSVLHVEDDPAFLRLVAKLFENTGAFRITLDSTDNLSTAIEQLEASEYDLVLLDLSLPDSLGLDTLSKLLPHASEIPIVVMTGRDDDAMAIQAMRAGAEDFLVKTEPNLRYCPRAAQLAITRRRRITLEELSQERDVEGRDELPEFYGRAERRQHPRYLLTRPIFAIPVLPDGSPADAYSADGFSIDVSAGGLQFEIMGLDRVPSKHVIVGIEAIDTVLHFATVEAKRVDTTEHGVRIGGEFATPDHDLLRRENLEPSFNPHAGRFHTALPIDTISKWVEFGIFRATLMDRVLICPQCQALPTFRNGCRICGSVRLHSRPLIHHFACAHVGYVSDFEQEGSIICPKCRTRNLIVGADYEHLNGPYRCLDCDWSDTDLEMVGECLMCSFRFPIHEALEEDLIGYHVNRLDPLALLAGN